VRELFDGIAPFTVGAEEELYLVDPETFSLSPSAAHVLGVVEGDGRVSSRRVSQIETASPICVTVPELQRELASVRNLVAGRLGDWAWPTAAGTHPGAASAGYGLRVHVAVGGGVDRTLAVYNALRTYLPEIVALGANGPFDRGEDSGLASVRPKLNGFARRTGVPPMLPSWKAFLEHGRPRWDLRLNTSHATLEVGAADAQTRVEDTATIAALVQSLVVELATRYDAGEELPSAEDELITTNLLLAARDGVNGRLVDLETGETVWTVDRLHELSDRLRETAKSVGCENELLRIDELAADGGGAGRQRRIHDEGGAASLVTTLARETAGSSMRRRAVPRELNLAAATR
jgi:carboxylate-amine ligase